MQKHKRNLLIVAALFFFLMFVVAGYWPLCTRAPEEQEPRKSGKHNWRIAINFSAFCLFWHVISSVSWHEKNKTHTQPVFLLPTIISPATALEGEPRHSSHTLEQPLQVRSTARTNRHYLPFQRRGQRSTKGFFFFLVQLASRADESN